ncbi:MAG: hypothetical protein QOK42_1730 [Frankiaceae bacterium]|jgi:hypothetical protein|nr:hypothetical protein [Frankiaceae bacterium]
MVSRNEKTGTVVRYTAINAFAVNRSPVPCALYGSPQATLMHGAQPLKVRTSYQAPAPVGATTVASIAENTNLLPGDALGLAVGWHASWCLPRTTAQLRLTLETGTITGSGAIPSPPCVPTAGQSRLEVGAWYRA